jgi:acyl-CoA hydrolase
MQTLTQNRFYALLRPGMEVFSAGCNGESSVFLRWLSENPACAEGVRFTGVWIPGVNRFDFTRLHPSTRMRGIFMSADFAAGFSDGRFELLPMPYSALYPWLKQQRFDLALLATGVRDAQGNFPLSLAADFSTAALVNAHSVALHANPQLPPTNAPFVPEQRVAWVVNEAAAPIAFDAGPVSTEMQRTAAHIAALIESGSTLQFGLGKMQSALCAALASHQNLRVHSGMVSAPLLDLLNGQQLAAPDRFKPPIVTGVALGNAGLYERLREPALARFAQAGYTHAISTLRQIPRFVSVNSVLEVDLLGQANGEFLNGAQISGAGGMVDFVRGARESDHGMSVLALPASANQGTRSRIVAQLDCPVSVSRADVDVIATEYGAVRVRDLDLRRRAEALIALAAPQFRDDLTRQWAQREASFKNSQPLPTAMRANTRT